MKQALLLGVIGGSFCGLPAYAQQPNILIILSDDMGYSDIGCYGGIIRTPNLDSLAAKGLRYTQFYNTARSCPSRASLLTGLHPHQTGEGHMTENRGQAGYRGELNDHCITIAELLRTTGYQTYAVGKWHLARDKKARGPKYNWPLQRGFDHFYGTIQGGGSYYDPVSLCRGNEFITVANDSLYCPEKFYYTNAIADNAIAFLREHGVQRGEKPFFMYMAFTAAHWPLQVPEEDVRPYYGAFDKGWEQLREAKYRDMTQRGLIDSRWSLSHDKTVNDWDAVSDKGFETRCMEVYAGVVSNMDRNIGRVVECLRQEGMLENTLIFYLQDNGGCAEPMERQKEPFTERVPAGKTLAPMAPDELQDYLIPFKTRDGRPMWRGRVMAGGEDTYLAYGKGWAHLSNTPFREYKHWVHEGGISTPLIACWPAGIAARGEIRWQPGQLTDLMATCAELANANYPTTYNGHDIYPCQGVSLLPSFKVDDPYSNRPLYWEHEGNRAIREGRWKLVYKATPGNTTDIPLSAWELYDMVVDRTEIDNLATRYPDRVADMAAHWQAFAERCLVLPWPEPFALRNPKQGIKKNNK